MVGYIIIMPGMVYIIFRIFEYYRGNKYNLTFLVGSCARCRLHHFPPASWLTVRTMPHVWNEQAGRCASVYPASAARAVKSWSVSISWTGIHICC